MASSICCSNRLLLMILSVLTAAGTLAEETETTHIDATTETEDSGRQLSESNRDQTELIEQCHMYAQSLMREKVRLRAELDAIKARIEAQAIQNMEEEEEASNESHGRSRGIRRTRGKRGSNMCDGGTVSQWACGSQCIFKLKGLCGLSLRAMCHC